MTDKERLEMLEQAERLIRDVEFSYPRGDENRLTLYRMVVNTFSLVGCLGPLIQELKETVHKR